MPCLAAALAVVELRRKRQRLINEIEELRAARTKPRTLHGRLGADLSTALEGASVDDEQLRESVRRCIWFGFGSTDTVLT